MIICYWLPVLWALMSDHHQMSQSRNPTRRSFLEKNISFSSLLLLIVVERTIPLSDFTQNKKDMLPDPRSFP